MAVPEPQTLRPCLELMWTSGPLLSGSVSRILAFLTVTSPSMGAPSPHATASPGHPLRPPGHTAFLIRKTGAVSCPPPPHSGPRQAGSTVGVGVPVNNPSPCLHSLLQLVISGPVQQSPHTALPPGFYPHIHTPPLGYGAVPAHPAAHPALPTHPGHTFISGMTFPFRPIH